MILKRAQHVTTSHTIQRRIKKRLGSWEAVIHGMLVEETLRNCVQYLTASRIEDTNEHRKKTYHSLVL